MRGGPGGGASFLDEVHRDVRGLSSANGGAARIMRAGRTGRRGFDDTMI